MPAETAKIGRELFHKYAANNKDDDFTTYERLNRGSFPGGLGGFFGASYGERLARRLDPNLLADTGRGTQGAAIAGVTDEELTKLRERLDTSRKVKVNKASNIGEYKGPHYFAGSKTVHLTGHTPTPIAARELARASGLGRGLAYRVIPYATHPIAQGLGNAAVGAAGYRAAMRLARGESLTDEDKGMIAKSTALGLAPKAVQLADDMRSSYSAHKAIRKEFGSESAKAARKLLLRDLGSSALKHFGGGIGALGAGGIFALGRHYAPAIGVNGDANA